MNKLYLVSIIFSLSTSYIMSQSVGTLNGTVVDIDLSELKSIAKGQKKQKNKISLSIPMPTGVHEKVELTATPIAENQGDDILTYSGKSSISESAMKITYTPYGFSVAMRYNGKYYFIEESEQDDEEFQLYSLDELSGYQCGGGVSSHFNPKAIKNVAKSEAPFPTGSTMRIYRMAAAATGEMTTLAGSQAAASAQIAAIVNGMNLIYELEAAVTFQLISKSVNSPYQIIFPNSATDPFTPQGGASAAQSQIGFNTMNSNGNLFYSEYDIGHTFHSFTISGNGYSASGQAGPDPCTNSFKARAWSQYSDGAPVGFIVGLAAHEVGHQFSAWHTFNANSGLCTSQWSSTAAVEPGSGTTLMAYGNNCSSGPNYVLSQPNNEDYFHTRSLEQINNIVAGDGTCITTSNTGNTPPVSNAGADITIPKGTPFLLKGTGSDVDNSASLTYVWDQFDIATSNDHGALGSSINGVGGYPAINSTTAPLFRSRMSSSPDRMFPALDFILNDNNNPDDNEGEDLPQVGRGMTFRFTVRDNQMNGGGVDSDELEVTVDGTKGPFEVTSPNAGTTVSAGTNLNITWAVNSTNTLSPNVKISLSIDGGQSFPFVIESSTPNDGVYTYSIPASAPSTSEARIRISSTHHSDHEFFDINNGDFTISGGSCAAHQSVLCPSVTVTADMGDNSLNLDESDFKLGSEITSKTFSLTGNTGPSPLANGSGSCSAPNFGYRRGQYAFSITQSGSYTIQSTVAIPFTIFQTPSYSFNSPCGYPYIGSTGYPVGGGFYSWGSSLTVNLTECTTYTLVMGRGNTNSFTMTFSGPGLIIEEESSNANAAYTYIAINESNNVISSVSSTADFSALAVGSYEVYGVSYHNTINTSSWQGMNADNVFTLATCAFQSVNHHDITVTSPPCSITNLSATPATCSGNNALFSMSFSPTNGSGSYQIINSSNQVVGSGSSSPISVTVTGPTSSGNQDFRVKDASNTSCISAALSASIPQCPPPCSITGVTSSTASCNGFDAEFQITAFTPVNGTGSYEVINANNQVVSNAPSGTAPIDVTVIRSTADGNHDFRIRDVGNNSCISAPLGVTLSKCIEPCSVTSGGNISGNISSGVMASKTFLSSDAIITSGTVGFQAMDSIILNNNFQVNSPAVFEVKVEDCEE